MRSAAAPTTTLWRRHKVSLIGIPFALALALLLSGQRLGGLWEPYGPHSPVDLDADGWGRIVMEIPLDPASVETREAPLEVRFEGIESSSTYLAGSLNPTEEPLPEGLVRWDVTLTFRADPDDPVALCTVGLIDQTGALHSAGIRGVDLATLDTAPCVPAETPGPRLDGSMPTDFEDNPLPPRPPEWQREVAFVTPADRTPTMVQVWVDFPQAAQFRLAPATLPQQAPEPTQ